MNESSQLTLVILAAGMSTRFGRLKQLEPVGPNKETLLEFSIYDAINSGIPRVVMIIREEIEENMKNYYSSAKFAGINIEFVNQPIAKNRLKPYGTGHAILIASKVVKGNFIVINADDYYGKDAYIMARKFFIEHKFSNRYAMVPYVLNETLSMNGSVNRGICKMNKERKLLEISELKNILSDEEGPYRILPELGKKREDKNALVSMNFWLLNSSILSKLNSIFEEFLKSTEANFTDEFQFPTVINQLISAKEIEVKVLSVGNNWFGFTYPEDKDLVVEKLKEKADLDEYPNPLFNL